ncbi:CBS domain-containing protein [Streptomyces sp. F001]
MRDHALRRLPVVDEGRIVGLLSLGDIASTPHAQEVLIALNNAPANH